MRIVVVTPLLLELYGDHEAGLLSRDELLQALRLLEAYVFRRAVCAIPSNSQQKTFATFSRALRREKSHYLPSFKAHLLALPSYRRFPSDEEFRREIQIHNLCKFNKSCSYWLRRLENHQRKEPITVGDYTIEHILPKNPELSSSWQQALGPDWKQIQEEWLHRLGNLTLTGYNPELSDRSFLDKRDDQEGGFRTSPLRLNKGLGQLEQWDADAIRSRYKAETNFVDIVPQAKRLRLSLNMPFADLDDPKGLAKNVTGIGRWGNGDVELGIATMAEVPYAIGLIRQSLERQLDDAPGSQ